MDPMIWKLADAKNRFSEVVERAISEGPQHVSRHGKEAVVVVSAEDFDRLTGGKKDFIEFLLAGPSLEGLDISRDQGPGRAPGSEVEW